LFNFSKLSNLDLSLTYYEIFLAENVNISVMINIEVFVKLCIEVWC